MKNKNDEEVCKTYIETYPATSPLDLRLGSTQCAGVVELLVGSCSYCSIRPAAGSRMKNYRSQGRGSGPVSISRLTMRCNIAVVCKRSIL